MKSIKTFCQKAGITEDQFYGKATVGGSLYLSGLTSIPEGFNPTVGGYLDLSGLTSIPEGFNPTVGGSLYLSGLTSIPEGFNPTVGGSLYLRGLTSIPEGFNPTVGGYLDLSGLTSIPEGFNPTVGGDLYLSGLTSIPEGFNPTAGRSIYLRDGSRYIGDSTKAVPFPLLKWNVNGIEYVCADGIMTEIINRRGNVYRVRRIAHKEIEYLITDGNGNYAHGATLNEAREDLIYKITDRHKSDYEAMTLSDTLTHADAVKCYRVITGACSAGTRNFVENILNGNRKEKYTITDIIRLTNGQYGAESFRKFFQK